MAQNFTEMVQPFLRLVDPYPVESMWTIVHLGPKAVFGNILFPRAVPEPAMYYMNIITFLFYFYCTQRIQQSVYSFFLMSFCLFLMYRMPKYAFPYIEASSWYTLMAVTTCHPGCEFSLDVFLLVSFSFWLIKKFENDRVKCFFALWFSFMAFFFLPNMQISSERHANASLPESVENNTLNATDFNLSTTEHTLVDEL